MKIEIFSTKIANRQSMSINRIHNATKKKPSAVCFKKNANIQKAHTYQKATVFFNAREGKNEMEKPI